MSALSMDDVKEPQKKRARTTSSTTEAEEGRKRGRPRVERNDESAADRRRTQIRMAQRAYRQRKEGTLEGLRKRVSDLTGTIEQMNKIFLDLNADLCNYNLPVNQLRQLRESSLHFKSLAETAKHPADDENPTFSRGSTTPDPPPKPSTDPQQMAVVKNVPTWLDQTVASLPPRQFSPNDVGMGYTMYAPEDARNSANAMMSTTLAQPFQPSTAEYDVFTLSREQMYNPSATIPPKLPNPPTYSFQETTFGRRLHRACIEAAYLLLMAPDIRPLTYERVFKLSLMSKDHNKLLQSFRSLISRGPDDDLDQWGAPLLHVGGAGTHYPKLDRFGNAHPRKKTPNVGLIGPATLMLLGDAGDGHTTPEMTIDIAGYEGEWLDPYDVEGYLIEKGIRVDPTSSFTECEITEWPSPGASTISISSPSTPGSIKWSSEKSTVPLDPEQWQALEQAGLDMSSWSDGMVVSGIGRSETVHGNSSWLNYAPQAQTAGFGINNLAFKHEGQQSLPLRHPSRRSVIVDVAKLVKALVHSTVCLGRSCGFKRRDVDRALAMASLDPF